MTAHDSRIKLLKTAYVVYDHVHLASAKQFLLHFGFTLADERKGGQEVFFQGYGPEPFCYVARQSASGKNEFGGAAYAVESRHELERATRNIAGASEIQPLDAPGGGEFVTLKDPIGHLVHLVWGQEQNGMGATPARIRLEKTAVNFESEKPRKGKFLRFEPGPAPVFKWGHYGVTCPPDMFQAMFNWYTEHLSLSLSDLVERDQDPVVAFFHIDRGSEFTDHHSFFIKHTKPGEAPKVAHAAFEVHDFDVQHLGHDYLEQQGYKLCWGVGRHVLGSQVFDYWFDPSGFVVEHYADGDLVNSETPIARIKAGPGALSVWGPQVPEVF